MPSLRGVDGCMSDTNAIKWLKAHNADFEVFTYQFAKIAADHAPEAIDRPLKAVCKMLTVEAAG